MLEQINIEVDEKTWVDHPRVVVGGKEKLPQAAKITPEGLKRREFRVDKPFIPHRHHFNYEATRDSIRHFAEGIGDNNPLFCDLEYAKKTKYSRVTAPGCFLSSCFGSGMPGGFSGIHGWYSGGEWEWYQPVYEGTKMNTVSIVRPLLIKKGRMTGGGNINLDYVDHICENVDTGELLGKQLHLSIRAERAAARSAGKERGFPKPVYTREDWLKILELYDREEVRGAEPRYWEDVQIGDTLGPMIKGPLTVRDMIAWLMGWGAPFMRAHKIEMKYEMIHPRVLEYVEETGEADVPELVHILDQFARAIGVERAYDYGPQRTSWLGNLFTNWMGDDGFLWKMHADLRAFNQIGDLIIFEGVVTNKYIEDKKCRVDIEAGAENQRGNVSMARRTSTVILPSKEHGPVVYPDPSPELVEEVKRARPLDDLIREGLI
ncbi:MaoC family dehydratase N-terminal domain-containing protein [Chloroflexota bacterium]